MRKKAKRRNSRKFRIKALFSRRRSDDETDWFRFEEEAAPVRVSPRKRIRRRLLAAKLAAFACLSVSIPLSLHWGYGEVFFKNEEFVLKTLQVKTDGVLSVVRLAEIANVAAGMNLMDLDLGLIQEQVGKLPQVEKVTVTRELPDRLHLAVRERIPVAWLSVPPLGIRPWDMERGFLLDEEGFLFRCLDLNEGMKSLPVVETFKLPEPVEGTRIASDGVRSGLKLILESEKRFVDQGIAVREVRVRDEWAVECDYSTDLKVTYGIYDYERGLADLALILDRMKESGRVVSTVNVAAERNIPVTFASVEPAAPAPTTAPAPSPVGSGVPAGGPEKGPEASGPGAAEGSVEGAASAAVTEAAPLPPADGSASVAVASDQEKHLRSILKGG
jgi:cell division protein FtsQ